MESSTTCTRWAPKSSEKYKQGYNLYILEVGVKFHPSETHVFIRLKFIGAHLMSLHMGVPTWQQFRWTLLDRAEATSHGKDSKVLRLVVGQFRPLEGRIFDEFGGDILAQNIRRMGSGYGNRKTGVGKTLTISIPFSIHRSFLFVIFAGVNLRYWHQKMHGTLARSIDTKPSRQVLPPEKWGPKEEAGSYEPTNHPFSGANFLFFVSGKVYRIPLK